MRPSYRLATARVVSVLALISAACSGADSISSNTPSVQETISVSITPKLDSLTPGATRQLVARVLTPQGEAQNAAVGWRSVDPAVASVSSLGIVSAVSVGGTRIIASAGGKADTATIVVVAPPTVLSISPNAMSVVLGDSIRLTATSSSASGASIVTSGVQWTTSDPSVADVSQDGVVTTNDAGTITISAKLNGILAGAEVQVSRAATASVAVSPTTSSIVPGQTQQLVAMVTDGSGHVVAASSSAKWSSSSTTIATVGDNGVVKGIAKGMAIITAQVQGKRATAVVNVLSIPVATISVSLASATLSVGQTTQATAVLKDAQGNVINGHTVAWQSSNPAMATVTASGLVSALGKSVVTISAIANGKVGSSSLTVAAPVPSILNVTPTSAAVTVGKTTQLTAEEHDANGVLIPNRPVTWSSDNSKVAPVSASGVASGAGVGSTVLHASADGMTSNVTITVTDVPAASIAIAPTSVAMAVGDSSQLTATVRDASGAALTNRAVSWSSNSAGVSVSPTGMLKALGAASATITAQVEGLTATATANVAPPPPSPVASVTVSLVSTSLLAGQSTQATAVLRAADGTILTGRSITWSSANTDVATVSSTGAVSAVAAGSASIVATSEGQAGAATVTVAPPPVAPVASVSLSASSTSLLVGQTTQIVVTLKDATGHALTGRTVGWTSSAPNVASVSSAGVVTALSGGTATITATSEGQSGSISLTVTAPPPPPAPVATVAVSLNTASLTVGQSGQATAILEGCEWQCADG